MRRPLRQRQKKLPPRRPQLKRLLLRKLQKKLPLRKPKNPAHRNH
jgi:hypothetical protein